MPINKSLAGVLKSLVPVGRADSVYEVASADRINAIQDAIRLLVRGDNIVAGADVRKNSGDGYVKLTGNAARRSFRGAGHFPWEIRMVSDDFGNPQVALRPGTLNNIVPSNMFDKFSITPDGTWYVTLHAETDGYRPTSCELRVDTAPSAPSDVQLNIPPIFFEVMIGLVFNLAVFQLVDGLLFAEPDIALYTVTESPAPGRPFYDNSYTWFINQY